jgi:hypothetical protein
MPRYKVQAVLNEIDGFDLSRSVKLGTPAFFGMNFPTVSTRPEAAHLGRATGRRSGRRLHARAGAGRSTLLCRHRGREVRR